jgi:hypothetical protein
MLFKRLNRSDAERVFAVFQANASGIAADDVVQLELNATSVDGVKIIQPTAAQLWATVGIADQAIANGGYGLVQIYGYRSTSRILITGTSLTAGCILGPVAGSDYLQSQATVPIGYLPAFVLLESASSAAGATDSTSKKVFIRAM